MGQFIEQLQKANSLQQEILSDKKQKQLAKEKKEILKSEYIKLKNGLFDKLEEYFIKNEEAPEKTFDYIIKNQEKIFEEFRTYIYKFNLGKTYNFSRLELDNLDFKLNNDYYKIAKYLYNRYKNIDIIHEKATVLPKQEKTDDWKFLLIEEFERMYNKYGLEAYFKLKECKHRSLNILGQGENFAALQFYERYNKKYFEEKKSKIKPKSLGITHILIAIFSGLFLGYKLNKKK